MVTEDKMGRACSTHGEKRNAYMILVGKPGVKRRLDVGGTIILKFREIGQGGID
jgi:hypothetical protein